MRQSDGISPLRHHRLLRCVLGLLPVREKRCEALVGQRVLHHLVDDFEGHGRHIGADEGGLDQVHGVADGGGEDFGFQGVVVVDGADLLDDLHAVAAHIVNTTDEGADQERAGLGDQQGLQRLEAEGHVHLHAAVGESLAGTPAVGDAGEFDDDVVCDFKQGLGLFDHGVVLGGDDLGRDGAGDDLADFLHAGVEIGTFLGDEAGAGGHVAAQAHGAVAPNAARGVESGAATYQVRRPDEVQLPTRH